MIELLCPHGLHILHCEISVSNSCSNFPCVVIFTLVLANSCVAFSRYWAFTTRCCIRMVSKAFSVVIPPNSYTRGRHRQRASPQGYWSAGGGLTARAYIAMARGSPCVVPSEEDISPLPGITHRTYVFFRTCANDGQHTLMLWSAVRLLKAFVASIRRALSSLKA